MVRPLDFCHNGTGYAGDAWPGLDDEVDPFHPLAWNGLFEREDRLGCALNGQLRRDVIDTRSRARLLPRDGLDGLEASVLLNTHWLNREVFGEADEAVMELIDLRTGESVESRPLWFDAVTPARGATETLLRRGIAYPHAVVLHRSAGLAAAVVRVDPHPDDETAVLVHCGWTCDVENSVAFVQAKRNRLPLDAGAWSDAVRSLFLVNGYPHLMSRLDEIQRELAAGAVDCRE